VPAEQEHTAPDLSAHQSSLGALRARLPLLHAALPESTADALEQVEVRLEVVARAAADDDKV